MGCLPQSHYVSTEQLHSFIMWKNDNLIEIMPFVAVESISLSCEDNLFEN